MDNYPAMILAVAQTVQTVPVGPTVVAVPAVAAVVATYTAGEVVLIVAALGTLIAGFAAAIVSIIVALRTGRSLQENTAVTQATFTEAKVISGHVNSKETKLSEQIISLERENKILREVIADKAATAALLAQAASSTAPPQARAARRTDAADAPVAQLAQIEANTAEIAANTAPE